MDDKKTQEQYIKIIEKNVKAAQDSGDIPELFTYAHKGKKWVLTLPHSVMEQKHMIHARNKYWADGSFESEKDLIGLIAANAQVDGRPVNIDDLSLGEVEVLKQAYLDGLLLPLSLGGDHDLMTYMGGMVAHTSK